MGSCSPPQLFTQPPLPHPLTRAQDNAASSRRLRELEAERPVLVSELMGLKAAGADAARWGEGEGCWYRR